MLKAQLTEHGPWEQAAAMPVLAEQQARPEEQEQNGQRGPEEEEGSEDMGTEPIPRAAGAGAEVPVPKPLPQQTAPTAEEKAQHDMTHLPYRSWCPVCVQAKARDDPHRKQCEPEQSLETIPVVQMDYSFARTDEGTTDQLKILSMVDVATGCGGSTVV